MILPPVPIPSASVTLTQNQLKSKSPNAIPLESVSPSSRTLDAAPEVVITTQNEFISLEIPQSVNTRGILIIDPVNDSSSEENVISDIIEISLIGPDGNVLPANDFEEPVTICFQVDSQADCLGYRNSAVEQWDCVDECLETSKNGTGYVQCGKTTHFTQFALLLTGAQGNSKCGSNSIFITGSGTGDAILVSLVSGCIICAILACVVCVNYLAKNYRSIGILVYGEEGRRIIITRESAKNWRSRHSPELLSHTIQ